MYVREKRFSVVLWTIAVLLLSLCVALIALFTELRSIERAVTRVATPVERLFKK